MADDLAAVVMAGGLGTRMKSATPKHLHPLLGRRLVDWVVEAVRPLGADPLVVVLSPEAANALAMLRQCSSSRATIPASARTCSNSLWQSTALPQRARPCSRSSRPTRA